MSMPDIRLASEQLAALEIVRDALAAERTTVRAELDEAYPWLRRRFEQRIEDDTAIGMCAERLGVPQVRNHERTGALIRAALGNAGFTLSERVVNAEAVSADA